jgi:moderate conductance mechanosensitive channel
MLLLVPQFSDHLDRYADLAQAYRDKWMLFLRDQAPQVVGTIIVALIALWVVRTISNRLSAISRRQGTLQHLRLQQLRTLASVIRSVGTFVVILLALLTILPHFGLDVAPLIASAGVVGLAIGFGAQTLVKDVITGFFILFENQFDIGDTVKVAGVQGVVEDIKLRSTVLRASDGTVHMVPNSQISIVSNLTRDWTAANLHVAVDYNEDSDRVLDILKTVAAELSSEPEFKDDLVGAIDVPGIERVSGREVDYLVSAKVRPGAQAKVSRELRRRIKQCFETNGIKAGAPAMIYIGDLPENAKA